MSFTAAHLVSAVIPPVPVSQWVLSIPKRLRDVLARDGEFLNRTIALASRHIEQCLWAHTSLADPSVRLGAMVCIQRFGSLLNAQTRLHLIVLDGLCQDNPEGGVRCVPAVSLDQDAVLGVQQAIRGKLLDYAAARGFLEPDEARDMSAWAHGGGLSLDASVLIGAHEREALERLLRYGAWPDKVIEAGRDWEDSGAIEPQILRTSGHVRRPMRRSSNTVARDCDGVVVRSVGGAAMRRTWYQYRTLPAIRWLRWTGAQFSGPSHQGRRPRASHERRMGW